MSIYPSAPNLVVVCVDKKTDSDYDGRFYHYYQAQPVPFSMLGSLIMQMEDLFNEINFPQAATQERFFKNKTVGEPNTAGGKKEMTKMQKPEELLNRKGDIATFVVHVQYRQNATWQGKIVWADKKEERAFRSALEMIKMMDNALETTAQPQQEPEGQGSQDSKK